MRIKFKPVTKIKRLIKGKMVVVFHPKYSYDGILNYDGTVLGYCPLHDKHVELKVNDFMIER